MPNYTKHGPGILHIPGMPMMTIGHQKKPAAAPAGWTLIANVGTGGSASTVTSGAIDTTGADLLVVVVSTYNNGSFAGVSDSKTNTWTDETEFSENFITTRISWSIPSSVGTSHTFTCSPTNRYPSICVLAFSGANATQRDQVSTGGDGNPWKPGALTATNNDSLYVTGAGQDVNGANFSVDAGYTETDEVPYSSGNHVGCAAAYFIQSGSPASKDPAWTSTGSPGGSTAAHITFNIA